MERFLTLILTLVLSSNLMLAQESYIEHTIQKGESVYRISRQYGVSVQSIYALNPGSKAIIYAGSTLRIPKAEVSSPNTNPTPSPTTNDDGFIKYEVKRGETKFSLARRFGVSISQLEQQNPHIVPMLQEGHILTVDKSLQEKPAELSKGQHRVVKGETLFGIANANGISLAQLKAANTHQLSGYLKIGQVLTIPTPEENNANADFYLVKPGDTKYSLAKRFKMSITELEQKNPHTVPMLMAGHRLKIDAQETSKTLEPIDDSETEVATTPQTPEDLAVTETPKTETVVDSLSEVSPEDTRYKDYVIEPKQTLYGLSLMAGMSIEEFTALNPKLKTAVIVGDIIKMPIEVKTVNQPTDKTKAPTTPADVPTSTNENVNTEISATSDNETLIKNLNRETANGIYFYTPFSGEELSNPEERQKILSAHPDFQKYVDFFQGAQVAIDSAKALNLDFEVSLIKRNIAKTTVTIDSPYEKNALLVPFLEQDSYFPSFTSDQDLSIIDIKSQLESQPSIQTYNAIPTDELEKTKTLKYLAQQNAKVIVVSDLSEPRNKTLIQENLPEATFLKADNSGFFNSETLEKALDKNQLNYIVFDSKKTIVLLNTTTTLLGKLSEYNIQLVMMESDMLSKQNDVSEMRYRILKLIYPSTIKSENKIAIANFETRYVDTFDTQPSEHAVLGFDVTLDVLLRISQNSAFENTVKTIISTQPHYQFQYQKIEEGYYSNIGLYLMQYNADKGVKVLD
ncbi:MAG: LysM peptidoglycan-binding domain-containing protein [Winogradskyella arenosi]